MHIIKLQGDLEKRRGIYYEYDADSTPLGEGGMGRVFKGFLVVERTMERKPVAVKAIYENIPERVIERARREASIQIDNDNLIKMLGFVEMDEFVKVDGGTINKRHYHVIMELLVGVTLEDIINGVVCDQNKMQIPYAAELHAKYVQDRYATVVEIMKSILCGLMALHDRGYIHRDIDPSNVMVTIDKKIKLIDFGICKQVVSLGSIDRSLTATGVFMGKVNYAAPELVLGDVKSQSYTTDIYSLGVLLFQLCTGHLPFSGTDNDILAANLHKLLPVKSIDSKDFRKIVLKATNKLQSNRYSSVAEMRVDLERASAVSRESFDIKKLALPVVVVLVVLLGWGIYSLLPEKEVVVEQKVVTETTVPNDAEIFQEAMSMIVDDDIVLRIKGKDKLQYLAEERGYKPAQLKYYILLLNSNDKSSVEKGFQWLQNLLKQDSLNHDALFECGLTLSEGNHTIEVPTIRQSVLQIHSDSEQANKWLYKAISIDATDYKSVYWALNNLIEKKIENESTSEDRHIVELYNLFMERFPKELDVTAELYKLAMAKDERILKDGWGLIK